MQCDIIYLDKIVEAFKHIIDGKIKRTTEIKWSHTLCNKIPSHIVDINA